jgi:hypothetical protein
MTTTYHVSAASTGGWRSLPWPFGLFEVTDTGLCVRSWHWSWWVADRVIPRESVGAIQATNRFGVLTLRIDVEGSKPVKINVSMYRNKLMRDLRRRDYPVG